MKCINCGKKIPIGRLEVLPNTRVCVNCSKEEVKVGITIWDKTSPSMVVVDKDEAKEFFRCEQIDGRMSRF